MLVQTKKNFKAARRSLGLSRKLLGACLGIDKRIIKAWESDYSWIMPTDEAWDFIELAIFEKMAFEDENRIIFESI